MRSQAVVLFLLFAAEAQAQSKYGPEGTWFRLAVAVVVAFFLFILIRRGAPVPGSRHWFWEVSDRELSPELRQLRGRAFVLIAVGAFVLSIAVVMAGHALLRALLAAEEDVWIFYRQMNVWTVVVLAGLGAVGIAIMLWGMRMGPKE